MTDCQVVGNLSIGSDDCYISINTSCNTESKLVCGTSIRFAGDTIQTVTVTGYATNIVHMKAPGKAGVSTTLTRKYDCDADQMRFICDGQGSSYVAGDVAGLASVITVGKTTDSFSASSASGPASVCMDTTQTDGLGLSYSGLPMSFTTSDDCTMLSVSIGKISGTFYLQSFNLTLSSGQIPVASYTLLRVI